MNERSDILVRARQGDRKALHSIYEQTIGHMTVVCSRYVTDKDAVKDILQDVYIKAFSSLDRFRDRGPGSLKAWISRITVNESVNWLRNRKKTPLIFEDMPLPDIPDDDPPEIGGMDAGTILEEIQKLPPGYRTVFNLAVLDGKSHTEIAAMLGISEGTSASQLHRAKALLAKQLKQRYGNR